MKKVIISGAGGFIGKALTKKMLEQEIEVWALVRNKEELRELEGNSCLHTIEAELKNYIYLKERLDVRGADAFFHLAWEGTSGEPFKNYQLQMNNAVYSGDALNLAIELETKKFIMASTINIVEVMGYFGKADIKPRYTCIYSTAKLAAEMICKTIAHQEGIDINVALIANSYGPGDYSRTIPNVLISHLLKKQSPDLVEGNFLYDWVYIDDIIAGLYAIAEKGKNQKSYYIGHRSLKTFKEIANEVKNILAPEVELRFGVYPDTMALDYDKIDVDELYKDTGYIATSDFKKTIVKTAKWLEIRDIKK